MMTERGAEVAVEDSSFSHPAFTVTFLVFSSSFFFFFYFQFFFFLLHFIFVVIILLLLVFEILVLPFIWVLNWWHVVTFSNVKGIQKIERGWKEEVEAAEAEGMEGKQATAAGMHNITSSSSIKQKSILVPDYVCLCWTTASGCFV